MARTAYGGRGWRSGGYPRPVPAVRVYRAAFAPALVALFVAAFSLTDRPAAVTTPFAPAGFVGSRAYDTLEALGKAYPSRPPGSDADRGRAPLHPPQGAGEGYPPAPAGLGPRPGAPPPRRGHLSRQRLPRLAQHAPR